MNTKKSTRFLSVVFLSFMLVSLLVTTGCKKQIKAEDLWQNAIYTEDKSFGEGEKTVFVEVKADDKSVTFTVKTDKKNLADALLEHSLVEGDNTEYGLYIKKVNGITADYDNDKAYWGLFKNGSMLMTGASDTEIANGDKYDLIYSK